jgi:pimeloyl-ACP methyl ester carboxylesterase
MNKLPNNRFAETSNQVAKTARHDPLKQGRNRLWTAISVVLATVGFIPTGPKAANSSTEPMRHSAYVGDAGTTKISYLKNGLSSDPLVILVHGTPGSATGWNDYVLSPPEGMEVIAVDRLGFGESGPNQAITSLKEQAEAVASLLPNTNRPVVLLGHSLGGPIVAWVAAHYPSRVSAVVFLAASMDPAEEKIHPMQWVGNWPLVRPFLPRAIRNANSELLALKAELVELEKMLPLIRAKVLIVHGTKDDLVPVSNVAFMQLRLSGTSCVQTTLLDGRNHFLPWNSPEVVRNAIRQALVPSC